MIDILLLTFIVTLFRLKCDLYFYLSHMSAIVRKLKVIISTLAPPHKCNECIQDNRWHSASLLHQFVHLILVPCFLVAVPAGNCR